MRLLIKTMRTGLKILALCSMSILLCHCNAKPPKNLSLASGQIVPLSALQDKWVFITYWADWCHTCLTEITVLNQLHSLSQSQPITVFGVHLTEKNPEALTAMAAQYDIQYPLITTLPKDIFYLGDVAAVPVTYVIDPNGDLKETLYGAQSINNLLAPLPSNIRDLARK